MFIIIIFLLFLICFSYTTHIYITKYIFSKFDKFLFLLNIILGLLFVISLINKILIEG